MRNIYSFNKSVEGYSHIRKDIVCQDYSLTKQDPNKRYSIAIVSDGHGDPDCFRSDKGSRFACNIALESLENFAKKFLLSKEAYDNEISGNTKTTEVQQDKETDEELLGKKMYGILTTGSNNEKASQIRYLTDNIISKWYAKIGKHYKDNNPTTLERDKTNSYSNYDVKIREDEIPHVYGATLICALWIEDFLLLIQQGDGGCTVFFENGEVKHPIPEDENCQGNITTSLCGSNSPNEIRHCILDLSKSEENVIGVFLGSDGVEDSYTDVEGNDIFYKRLMYNYFSDYKEVDKDFLDYLQQTRLPDLSKRGSADDISVAGLVDFDEMKTKIDIYSNEIDSYDAQKQFDIHEQKVVSMKRKYEFLEKNVVDFTNKLSLKKSEIKDLEEEIQKLQEDIENKKKIPFLFISSKEEIKEERNNILLEKEKLQKELQEVDREIENLQKSKVN